MNRKYSGFSLMEMMVVLLIVAIIAAASAPMVTKKMSRSAGTGDSPWVFTGMSNSIAYLGGNNDLVLIGASASPGDDKPRLFISGKNNRQHIGFGNSDDSQMGYLTFNIGNNNGDNSRIGMSNKAIPNDSVMFGGGQSISNNATEIVAIGKRTVNNNVGTIAIGSRAQAGGSDVRERDSIAIGCDAISTGIDSIAIGGGSDQSDRGESRQTKAIGSDSLAIGSGARAEHSNGIAIGADARTQGEAGIAIGYTTDATKNSIAIGYKAIANNENSIAIGNGVTTSKSNQIVLGDPSSTVYIPGHLVVGKNTYLGVNDTNSSNYTPVYINTTNNRLLNIKTEASGKEKTFKADDREALDGMWVNGVYKSDRRLKNVGKPYTSGIEDLKKLEFFHYTFKDDKDKTPRVGVMAQDLQKVFPDAVTKGEDGYLRIRWEDMFYAVINSVKELDKKICEVVDDIVSVKKTIENQQEQIDTLKSQNVDLIKRLEKLEKASKKK